MRTLIPIFVAALSFAFIVPSRGEFAVKYLIDGHIAAHGGACVSIGDGSCWIAEMDGDATSREMLVFGNTPGNQYRRLVGITHISTGETEWVDSSGWDFPTLVSLGDGYNPIEVPPFLVDVDADGLTDALVPVIVEPNPQGLKTIVVGWVGASGNLEPQGASSLRGPAVYPNPSGGTCRVSFSVPSAGSVAVELVDVGGRIVRRLLEGPYPAGDYSLVWDGRDDQGREVAAGVYLTRVTTAEGTTTGRVVLAK